MRIKEPVSVNTDEKNVRLHRAYGLWGSYEDKFAYVFSTSDRFLIIDLKNRKEVIHQEYRPNPYAEICKEKYPIPTDLGNGPSEEELEIYNKIAMIVQDCKYVAGKNFCYYPARALRAAGSDALMKPIGPWESIESLIKSRRAAGFRD